MKKGTGTFKFLVGDVEKRMIETLAQRLQRSKSDAVRLVIREAVKSLAPDEQSTQPETNPSISPAAGSGRHKQAARFKISGNPHVADRESGRIYRGA